MPLRLPPPAPKKTGSAWAQFVNKWAKQYPTLKANAPDIQAAADEAHIDPIYFASVLLTESGANYDTKNSSKGAIGIGQLMPSTFVGQTAPWDPTHVITVQDLRSPGFNLRLSAYFLAQQIGGANGHGYAHAYDQGYNPGYVGPGPQKFMGSYIPKTPSTSPPTAVGPQAPGGTAPVKPDVTSKDKWVVLGADGRIKLTGTGTGTPPKNVLTYGPTPLTVSTFNQVWKQSYQDTFFAYTGHAATGRQVAAILKNAPSIYTLSTTLAAQPGFTKSPTYKAHAPGIIAIAKQMFGQNWKVDSKLVSNAIAQNWDQATLTANLKARPEYVNGPEFQDSKAKMSNVYSTIYGTPGPEQNSLLQAVTKQGWAPDQFALWLRQQPEYKQSEEFKSRIFGLGQQLGLITGTPATLTAAQAELGAGPAAPSFQQAPPPPPPAPPVTNPPRGEAKNQPPFTRKAA